MHINAKLLWSRIDGVDLTVVRRKIAFLPGEISLAPERVTVINRSEKSAEAVVAACMERRAERGGKPEVMSLKRAWHQKLRQLGRIEKTRVNPDSTQFVMKLVRRHIKQKGLGRLAIPVDNLNFSNRPVRTCMPGGVGGATPLGASPIPINLHMLYRIANKDRIDYI